MSATFDRGRLAGGERRKMAGVLKFTVIEGTGLTPGKGLRAGHLLVASFVLAYIILWCAAIVFGSTTDATRFYTVAAVLTAIVFEIWRRSLHTRRGSQLTLVWMHAFAVVSFSWNVIRTRAVALDDERFDFSQSFNVVVLEGEEDFQVKFSVYGKKVSRNVELASCTASARLFLQHPSTAQPLLRRFSFVDKPSTEREFWLPMLKGGYAIESLDEYDADADAIDHDADSGVPRLHLRVENVPLSQVEREAWKAVIKDWGSEEEPGELTREEVETFFDYVGYPLDASHLDKSCAQCPDKRFSYDEVYDILSSGNQRDMLNNSAVLALVFGASNEANAGLIAETHVSEASVVRGWLARFSKRITAGRAVDRNVNGVITVKNRHTGALIEEKIATFVMVGIRLMYMTRVGESVLKVKQTLRVLQRMSERQGRAFDDPRSRARIAPFIRYFNLNVNEMLEDVNSFKTFNEFFYRKLKPSARPIAGADDDTVVVSAADCRCNAFATISDATTLWIKGSQFTLASLTQRPALASEFNGGALAIFRLAPQDYHRFHWPVSGTVVDMYDIDGALMTVNPMAVREPIDVYTNNKRHVAVLESPMFGKVLYVSIGATMVGSIVITESAVGSTVRKGDEHGYFAFGGSTILVVFQPNRVLFDSDLLDTSSRAIESLVRMGDRIGTALPT